MKNTGKLVYNTDEDRPCIQCQNGEDILLHCGDCIILEGGLSLRLELQKQWVCYHQASLWGPAPYGTCITLDTNRLY